MIKSLSEIREYMQGAISNIGEDFTEPDDDWLMVACIQDTAGQFNIVPLENSWFADDSHKDTLAIVLKAAMNKLNAVNYAVLLNVHGKTFRSKKELNKHYAARAQDNRRIEDEEGAYEMLILICGDAQHEEVCSANIIRNGTDPPTLDDWVKMSDAEFGGRFTGLNALMRPIEV